jgi:hypothetical protein
MIEDHLRKDHDPTPSEEERDWLRGNFYARLARAVLMISYAIVIGVSTSVVLSRNAAVPAMAAVSPSGGASTPAE